VARRWAGVVGLAGALWVAGCQSRGPEPGELRGIELPTRTGWPAFVLQDLEGQPFDFPREAAGFLTILFFGYTHCPDVCPVHMANLAAVLRDAAPSLRQRVKVVFVTTDPARDTPERLRRWLGAFDPGFIALTGDATALAAAQVAAGVIPAQRGDSTAKGYDVGHAAQVQAYSPRTGRVFVYPFGTRQEAWAHDLPRLLTLDTVP